VGIFDVLASRETVEFSEPVREFMKNFNSAGDNFKFPEKIVKVSFIHAGASDQAVEFSDESSGTKKLFNIADDWWRLANEQVTLLADELGASLHPRLLDRLVRAVNDAPAKRPRSQLIFTTHETGLLEGLDGLPPALRRDQVYFTKKNAKGVSELYSLAEFKDDARPVHNIRKRYLSGLYGAIPSVERLSL
jgi:AAA15 family ATPase/GTPase